MYFITLYNMKKQINQVKEFNDAFKLPYSNSPVLIDLKMQELRVNLLKEEIEEYAVANSSGNLVEVADAAADILYLAFGLVIQHGLQDIIENVFDAVQASNMSKLGSDGHPIYREDGKVIKGPDFFTPTKTIELELEKGGC